MFDKVKGSLEVFFPNEVRRKPRGETKCKPRCGTKCKPELNK